MSQDEYPKTMTQIIDDHDIVVLRVKVPGGWLVTIRDSEPSTEQSTTILIPDPQHHWTLES